SLLAVPSRDVRELVRQDPVGFFALLRDALGASAPAIAADPTAAGIQSADGRRRLIIARPRRPPFDTTFSHALDDRLRRLQADLRGRTGPADEDGNPLPPLGVEFAGGHRIAVETEG